MITVKMPLAHAVPVRDVTTGATGVVLQEHPGTPASPGGIELYVTWSDGQDDYWGDNRCPITDAVEVDLEHPQGFAHGIRWVTEQKPWLAPHRSGIPGNHRTPGWERGMAVKRAHCERLNRWSAGETTDVDRHALKSAIEEVQS